MGLAVKRTEDNYVVGKSLGKGTFGDVCSASSKCGQLVALKILRDTSRTLSDCGQNNDCFERLREVIFFRNVPAHPNLIELYEMYQDMDTDNVVFSLEHMRGNMYQLIEYQRKRHPDVGLDTLLIARVMNDILKGLKHIHAHGFIHRDVKPENLLWAGTGRAFTVKLADFGLSRAYEPSSDRPWSGYVATRWYRAPEQLLDEEFHTPGVDIWACSLILYEICNLAPLFPGSTTSSMVKRQVEALGIPQNSAVGGPSLSITRKLRGIFGDAVDREKHRRRGYVVTPEWLRWETHECFTDCILAGLQWDPERRSTATEMIDLLCKAVREYRKLWLPRAHPEERARSA